MIREMRERLAVSADLNLTERPAFAMRDLWWYDVLKHTDLVKGGELVFTKGR